MLLKVLDKNLIQIGLLSEDVLLLWGRKYDKADTFQITAPFKEEYRNLLLEEMFVVKDNDNTIGVIENIEYRVNEKSEEIIIAKGKEASSVLENRFIDGTYRGNDTIPNHIKNIIAENAIEPENKKRVIPGLEFEFDKSITSNSFPRRRLQASYGNVLKKVESLLKEENLGYKVEYKPIEGKSGKFVFILYKGEDKTYSQDKNRPVIFSRSNDNILTQEYLKSSDDYKNVGLIAGQGEGQDRVKTYVGNIELEGLDRKEIYIDARDIEKDEDMTDEEYLKELKARGETRLEELDIIETLEGQVNYRANLEYRKDFDLGDLVVVEDPRWNLVLETRIIEIEEIYEEYFDIRISFGNKIPNLIEEIREIKDKQEEGGVGGGGSVGGGGGATGEDIENIEIDLEQIKKDIKDLQINKADKKKLEEEIARLENGKAEKSEIERLEKMIQEIVEGEGIKYIIPRTTSYPVRNEIFYQPKTQAKPKVRWRGDDWNSWDVSDINHLKLDDDRYYSTTRCNILENEGSITLKFEKNDRGPHILKQKRDGKNIVDTGHIRDKEKEHTLYVKPGDEISIMASFVGSVYIEYKGEESDLRLSVYKNGQIEEVANKRLVEKRLEDFTLKDELYGKVGLLDDLKTKEKENIVAAINELKSIKADQSELDKKADEKHTHSANDIIETLNRKFVNVIEKDKIDKIDDKADKDAVTRTSTIVIANYDSHESSKKGADIVINRGEDASTKINNAIQSLRRTGGEIRLMEGQYQITGENILIHEDNITLSGLGSSTVLLGGAVITHGQDVHIQNLTVNNSHVNGITIGNNSKAIIDTVCCYNSKANGVQTSDTAEAIITNTYIKNSGLVGILLASTNTSKVYNCTVSASGTDYQDITVRRGTQIVTNNLVGTKNKSINWGIYIWGDSNNSVVTHNILIDNYKVSTVVDNGKNTTTELLGNVGV